MDLKKIGSIVDYSLVLSLEFAFSPAAWLGTSTSFHNPKPRVFGKWGTILAVGVHVCVVIVCYTVMDRWPIQGVHISSLNVNWVGQLHFNLRLNNTDWGGRMDGLLV